MGHDSFSSPKVAIHIEHKSFKINRLEKQNVLVNHLKLIGLKNTSMLEIH